MKASLSVALAASQLCASGCAQAAGRVAASKPGSIAGQILHPAKTNPPMRICAIGSGAPERAKRVCVKTRSGQERFRIAGLPPDDYAVIAQPHSGALRAGGHVQPVQCIRAPCPEMPARVFVASGARLTGIDINGFYPAREDFPQMPVDD